MLGSGVGFAATRAAHDCARFGRARDVRRRLRGAFCADSRARRTDDAGVGFCGAARQPDLRRSFVGRRDCAFDARRAGGARRKLGLCARNRGAFAGGGRSVSAFGSAACAGAGDCALNLTAGGDCYAKMRVAGREFWKSMEELRLSHAWPPLARFCAAAAFFVGVSVMVGCGGGGGSPSVSAPPVDKQPIAVGQADGVAYLPIGLESGSVAYTFNVQTQGPRTISIAVESGGNDFMVAQICSLSLPGSARNRSHSVRRETLPRFSRPTTSS